MENELMNIHTNDVLSDARKIIDAARANAVL